MRFRLAAPTDLDEILEIVSQASEFLRSCGVDQWQSEAPNRKNFEADMKKGSCYVIEIDGHCAAVAAVDNAPEQVYDEMSEGMWLTSGSRYAVAHRTAVSEKYRGKGIGNALLSYAENRAAEMGCASLRIDTHEDNTVMRSLLLKRGYAHCGKVYWDGPQNPRLARVTYEKILEGREQ